MQPWTHSLLINTLLQVGGGNGFLVVQTQPTALDITNTIGTDMMIVADGQIGVRRSGNIVLVSHFPSGVVLEADVRDPSGPQNYYINVRIFVPRSHMGDLQGIFGNFDGNQDNEFARRDGTVIIATGGQALFDGLSTCEFFSYPPFPTLISPLTKCMWL